MWNGSELRMLEVPTLKSSGRGREVNWALLNDRWDDLFFWADQAFLERVMSRPEEGVSSAFKFGTVFGGMRGMLAAKATPTTLVTPTVWKKYFGLSASKDAAVLRASELFPAYAELFYGPKGGKKDGTAEAALIARYGYDKLTKEQ